MTPVHNPIPTVIVFLCFVSVSWFFMFLVFLVSFAPVFLSMFCLRAQCAFVHHGHMPVNPFLSVVVLVLALHYLSRCSYFYTPQCQLFVLMPYCYLICFCFVLML